MDDAFRRATLRLAEQLIQSLAERPLHDRAREAHTLVDVRGADGKPETATLTLTVTPNPSPV